MSKPMVEASDFTAFFEELHGYPPYPWQRRLAERAVLGDWPSAIDLPTGSGKTGCIDIAIFALACQVSRPPAERTAPMRVFFCVNRRVIVDEACERARMIARKLAHAERDATDHSVLKKAARSLRVLAGTGSDDEAPPLDVLELRGGVYRDNRWARSMVQPTVVCTTIDQLGSRLLFRGYGVSDKAAPIQAALIAYDSLVLLDEAHISRPFMQSLDAVSRYLDPDRWADQSVSTLLMRVVPMTATPSDAAAGNLLRIEAEDRDERLPLLKRLRATKPVTLHEAKKGDVASEVLSLIGSLDITRPLAVGIIVNRVGTAREIHQTLCALQEEPNEKKRKIPASAVVELVIGSMRPIDRDEQATRLREVVGPKRPIESDQTTFVVATQCLEVGADYDFDVLITECASLDALRQRFGRLNRSGREINARGFIVASSKQIIDEEKLSAEKPADVIYGNSLTRTWNWLARAKGESETIDFGIDAFDAVLREHTDDGRIPEMLLAPSASKNAPVMLPAYVDLWCQTAPRPVPDPDIALFLHGEAKAASDVQVCWRAELVESDDSREDWIEAIALMPPTSAECMSVARWRVQEWLSNRENSQAASGNKDESSDALGVAVEDDSDQKKARSDGLDQQVIGVLWRGVDESVPLRRARDLRPGDTVVLPTTLRHSELLGHVETTDEISDGGDRVKAVCDVAERAYFAARRRIVLRLHPALKSQWPQTDKVKALFDAAKVVGTGDEIDRLDWNTLVREAVNSFRKAVNSVVEVADTDSKAANVSWLADQDLTKVHFRFERYAHGSGVVLISRERITPNNTDAWLAGVEIDEGDDASSFSRQQEEVMLDDHTVHVINATASLIERLGVHSFSEPMQMAAKYHDLGKADPRFQAMLRRSSQSDAWLYTGTIPRLLAKSATGTRGGKKWYDDMARAGLPKGFRHEMLTVQLAERVGEIPKQPEARDLTLHLIAAHHGHARPFAPVVLDDELPDIEAGSVRLSHEQRIVLPPPHRLDSGIAERFWTLTRRYGWWGLAYLESVLRLGDQKASADEASKPNTTRRSSAQAIVEVPS